MTSRWRDYERLNMNDIETQMALMVLIVSDINSRWRDYEGVVMNDIETE